MARETFCESLNIRKFNKATLSVEVQKQPSISASNRLKSSRYPGFTPNELAYSQVTFLLLFKVFRGFKTGV
jgi:hypothetical protein